MTQEAIIVNYLAKRPGKWVPEHQLEKAELDGYWIGTRGGRTARELAARGKFIDIDGIIGARGNTYFIERTEMPAKTAQGRRVNYAYLRVTHLEPQKPKYRYEMRNGIMHEIPNL